MSLGAIFRHSLALTFGVFGPKQRLTRTEGNSTTSTLFGDG